MAVALPAAYAFSRYRFLGDKQLFFWLLTNRMAPPAVFALPFFQLYSAVGLFDTHIAVALAHCLFTVPLSVWILEGFFSGVPTELDEMAHEIDFVRPAPPKAGREKVLDNSVRSKLLDDLLNGTAVVHNHNIREV